MALLRCVRETPDSQVAWLARVYLSEDAEPSRRARIIDALLEHGSPLAQVAVIDHVSITAIALIS